MKIIQDRKGTIIVKQAQADAYIIRGNISKTRTPKNFFAKAVSNMMCIIYLLYLMDNNSYCYKNHKYFLANTKTAT